MSNHAPKKFNIDKPGLEAFFGELEAKVMEALWRNGPGTVSAVKRAVETERRYSYNTVMTVLLRLSEKGMVRRRKGGGAVEYLPVQKKEQFMRNAAKAVLSAFFGKRAVFSPAQFAEALDDVSEDDLKMLEERLKRKP